MLKLFGKKIIGEYLYHLNVGKSSIPKNQNAHWGDSKMMSLCTNVSAVSFQWQHENIPFEDKTSSVKVVSSFY